MVRVHAKTLVPGPHPVPALMLTTPEPGTLLPELLERGWAPFGGPPGPDPAGEVVVGPDRVRVVVDGRTLLDDEDVTAPTGWWPAVEQLGHRCVVVVCAEGDVDLAHHQPDAQLAALVDSGRAVFAALPVGPGSVG